MDPYALRGHIGAGRLKEGVGGGLIDLKFETPSRVSNLCSQNTGQFYSSQNEENWINFSGLGDRFWVSWRSFLTSGRPNLPSGRPVRGSGTPDPRPRTLILTSRRPKSVVREPFSPLGERILTSGGGQNPGDLANFWVRRSQKGQFQGSQPGKGSRVVAPKGIGSPFLDPEGSANPEGPKNASQI